MKTIEIFTPFTQESHKVTVDRWQTFKPISGQCKFTLKVRFNGHERLFKVHTNDTEFYDQIMEMSYSERDEAIIDYFTGENSDLEDEIGLWIEPIIERIKEIENCD